MAEKKPVDKKSIPRGKTAAPGQTQPQAHIQQAAPTTSVYKPPPGVQPCPSPAPAPTPPPAEQPILTELVQRIIADHDAIVAQHDTMQQILSKMTEMVTILGTDPKPEEDYYDTPRTVITVGTLVQPNSPDQISNATTVPVTLGYQMEQIYATLQRIAPKITVINDGSDILFVITSPDGKSWSSEVTILIGEARTFWNVWEARLRSPTAGIIGTPNTGGVYRVTERDYWLAYTTPAGGAGTPVPNRAAFIAQSIIVPDLLDHALDGLDAVILAANPGIVLPIAVPSGFAIVIRANVNNVGAVYISALNATTAVARDTLNPGDAPKLFITNSSLIHIAVANINDIFDILVEL